MEIKKRDRVKLPFNEEGIVTKVNNFIWGHNYYVRITTATISEVNEIHDFKKEQLIKI